jgi:hypothetical protein
VERPGVIYLGNQKRERDSIILHNVFLFVLFVTYTVFSALQFKINFVKHKFSRWFRYLEVTFFFAFLYLNVR